MAVMMASRSVYTDNGYLLIAEKAKKMTHKPPKPRKKTSRLQLKIKTICWLIKVTAASGRPSTSTSISDTIHTKVSWAADIQFLTAWKSPNTSYLRG